jgi:6-phosphogluconolactonase
MKRIQAFLLLGAALAGLAAAKKPAGKTEYFVYVGTYTREKSQGIYVCRLNAASGNLSAPRLAAESENPSFLALHPSGRFLYAVGEVDNYGGGRTGSVTAYAVDRKSGDLRLVNRVSSKGAGPCYVTVDRSGKDVLVANYSGGSVAVLPIGADGRLAEASAFVQHSGSSVDARQRGPHAHSINVSSDNRFAVAADLGLDQLLVYRFDAARGSLAANDPPYAKLNPGAGPRHFAFHPGGRYLYAINELQSTVTAFAFDGARGALRDLQTVSTLPTDFRGNNSTAEVQVHPSGKFLYGSNRGHDSIAVFAIDSRRGTLTPIEQVSTQGQTPRNFGIDPTGSYLLAANQMSHSVVVFRIDPKSGRLTPNGQRDQTTPSGFWQIRSESAVRRCWSSVES